MVCTTCQIATMVINGNTWAIKGREPTQRCIPKVTYDWKEVSGDVKMWLRWRWLHARYGHIYFCAQGWPTCYTQNDENVMGIVYPNFFMCKIGCSDTMLINRITAKLRGMHHKYVGWRSQSADSSPDEKHLISMYLSQRAKRVMIKHACCCGTQQ